MKRSEINRVISETIDFLRANRFALPPFAFWPPEKWKTVGHEADEIRRNRVGWDITDFNGGDFSRLGLAIFTLRNGNYNNPEDRKPYAEKVLISREGQAVPLHFHRSKMEDIIVRGGGNMMIRLFNSNPDATKADTDVDISVDGIRRTVPAGTVLRLTPGESICLVPGVYHSFWGEEGKGTVLLGEVSSVNDDYTDNVFHDTVGRFPAIEEDESPIHLLATEYPDAAD